MLHENASRPSQRIPIPVETVTENVSAPALTADPRLVQLREWIGAVFVIEREILPNPKQNDLFKDGIDPMEEAELLPMILNPDGRLVVVFGGAFKGDTETIYEQLDQQLAPLNLIALFRAHTLPNGASTQRIYILQGRIKPAARTGILNLLLFILTLFSVMYVGYELALSEIASQSLETARQIQANGLIELWRGLPYAVSILLILGAHELGHYFAARRHNLTVTLPYFLPLPLGFFGTLGAFIQLLEPIRNRKVLLEVGAAGPLAGLVFALPILIIGLITSQVSAIPTGPYFMEGNSLLYALTKVAVFGQFLPNGQIDVMVNQLAWAGWTGLFVTGLNLIPVGQLDGGHVLYSLLGQRTQQLYLPTILAFGFVVILSNGELLLLLLLLLFFGRTYAVPLDDITPLDRSRRYVAWFTLLIFILVFVPIPFMRVEGQTAPAFELPSFGSVALPIALIWISQQWAKRWGR
ncbi:MAG: site-2 protease family protein [Anaerolineae bacterium]|jgi:membrane-associated protease RseP (regulator of RpoE activity)|nr:site-2 protease family protein [Anaerolineae bacterium]